MGVAVPEEFRGDLAMAGDWQVVSERVIYDHDEEGVKKEEDGARKEEREHAAAQGLSIGVRKRKYEGQEDEAEEGNQTGELILAQKGWESRSGSGSGLRIHHKYIADSRGEEEDLDSLLGKTKVRVKDESHEAGTDSSPPHSDTVPTMHNPHTNQSIKQEEDTDETETKTFLPSIASVGDNTLSNNDLKETLKQYPDTPPEQQQQAGIIFKKRKAKPIRTR